MSWRHGLDASQHVPSGWHVKDVLVHQPPRDSTGHVTILIHECIDPICDARNTLNAHRHEQGDEREKVAHGYHPCCGGCYNSAKDRSLSPTPPGP
jgi:hypothetical protein